MRPESVAKNTSRRTGAFPNACDRHQKHHPVNACALVAPGAPLASTGTVQPLGCARPRGAPPRDGVSGRWRAPPRRAALARSPRGYPLYKFQAAGRLRVMATRTREQRFERIARATHLEPTCPRTRERRGVRVLMAPLDARSCAVHRLCVGTLLSLSSPTPSTPFRIAAASGRAGFEWRFVGAAQRRLGPGGAWGAPRKISDMILVRASHACVKYCA